MQYKNKVAQTAKSFLVASSLLLNSEARAQKIVAAFRAHNPNFVRYDSATFSTRVLIAALTVNVLLYRAFWNLIDTTLLRHTPKVTGPRLAVNRVLCIPAMPIVFDGAEKFSILVIPGVVGRVGELEAQGCALDRQRIFARLNAFSQKLLPTSKKGQLAAVGTHIKEELNTDASLTEDERMLLQSTLFQMYSLQVDNIQAREEALQQAEARVGESPDCSWKEAAGRRQGSTSYTFGDLTLTLLNKLHLGGQKVVVPDLVPQLVQVPDDASNEPVGVLQDVETVNVFGSVRCRLLSYLHHQGQVEDAMDDRGATTGLPLCPRLLIHFHGGGFMANSSQSHESYLRDWARKLKTPILSVDYTLALHAPYPRAAHECFHAYAWAVRHADKLGSSGERICVAGDSAGGNLSVSVTLRALIEVGLMQWPVVG